ncbi:MAG: sensor histidine kinase, partial [Stackebrandtia sp.]
HVTAMVVQADAAQLVLDSAPPRAADGLVSISGTGRRALTELRYLLGVLEATGAARSADRAPLSGRVADLVEQARVFGQPVEWTEQGEPRGYAVDVELAMYRVVQEALTNAMKYASGAATSVRVRHDTAHVEIQVSTAGSARVPAPRRGGHASGGRGLTGLRERVRMLDGELSAGPRPDGGFSVHATIPSRSDS